MYVLMREREREREPHPWENLFRIQRCKNIANGSEDGPKENYVVAQCSPKGHQRSPRWPKTILKLHIGAEISL